jgi:hypothetical protein
MRATIQDWRRESWVGLTSALKYKSPDAMEKNKNILQTSNVIFETTISCFLASNLLAQFSRQILGMARRYQKFVGIWQYVHF